MLPKLCQAINQVDPEKGVTYPALASQVLTLPIVVDSMDGTGLTAHMCLAALDVALGGKGIMVVLMCLIPST